MSVVRALFSVRMWGIVVVSAIVGMVIFTVLDDATRTNEALSLSRRSVATASASTDNAVQARNAAARRIDSLQSTIAALTAQLAEAQSASGAANARVDALIAQIHSLGARPVVTVTSVVAPATPNASVTTTTAPRALVVTTTTTTIPRRIQSTTTTRVPTTTTTVRKP